MPDPKPVARSYTPAAGYHFLTPFYDFGVAVTTRERVWRDRLVRHMALGEGDVILDIGSGAGNLALAIARHSRGDVRKHRFFVQLKNDGKRGAVVENFVPDMM